MSTMAPLTFEDYTDFDRQYQHPMHLMCPVCGGGNLHHAGVTVYDRSEDAETVRETHVGVDVTIGTTSGKRNPSSRRDGLAIEFYCEGCHADDPEPEYESEEAWEAEHIERPPAPPTPYFRLLISQCKGDTQVQWEIP